MPRDSTPTPSVRRSGRLLDRNRETVAVEPATRRTARNTRKHPTRKEDDGADDSRPASPTSDRELGEGSGDPPEEGVKWDVANDPAPGETDSAKISQPIYRLVHGSLKEAWTVNNTLPMCFIFDAISPARRFKRGMRYTDSDKVDFPDSSPY